MEGGHTRRGRGRVLRGKRKQLARLGIGHLERIDDQGKVVASQVAQNRHAHDRPVEHLHLLGQPVTGLDVTGARRSHTLVHQQLVANTEHSYPHRLDPSRHRMVQPPDGTEQRKARNTWLRAFL